MPWTSKTVPGAAPKPMKKPSRVIVRLASKEGVLVKAPKPMELEAMVPPD